jgi:hypothetical protein
MYSIRLASCSITLAVIALSLELCVPNPAISQPSNQCLDASSLWLPSDSTSGGVVNKWQKDITYSIVSNAKSTAAADLVKTTITSFSHRMGLKIIETGDSNETSVPDLLVVVDPNVSNDAPLLRDLALKFFQPRLSLSGRFQINSDAWNAELASVSPKCVGLDVDVNHAKALSFVVIQEDATSACVSVGLGQTFGLIGVKNYYTVNGEKMSRAILEEALRGLYSPEIRIGMKKAEAMERLNEVCSK